MVFLILVLVTLVVAISAWQRCRDFLQYHNAIARRAVEVMAEDIRHFLDNRDYRVKIFAQDHVQMLARIAANRLDYGQQEMLRSRVERYFPDYVSLTLTTATGEPLLEDFEGYVSDLCIQDIRRFITSGHRATRLHPNPYEYHIDIMAGWKTDNGVDGILMISFPTEVISQLLEVSQAPGHLLLLKRHDGLIEITAQGPRNVLKRVDFHLTPDETDRILALEVIEGSRWQVVDMRQAGFYEGFRNEIVLQSILQIVIFFIVAGVIWYFIRRTEHRQSEIEKMKDEFISVVSHELRTPLTSLQGALSLLNSYAVPEPYKRQELFNLAQRNTGRLTELVNDLLDVRSLETGRMELKRAPVEIDRLVRESVDDTLGYGERFSVKLKYDNQLPGERKVLADPVRIGQVITNLLSNAIKFSPPGETVHVRVLEPSPGRVQVRVEDKGPGIDPQFRNRIFQRFAQADSTDSRKVPGTGLGLHIVKSLVTLHAGSVDFDSRVGEGSSFYFELPVIEPHQGGNSIH